MDICTQSYSCFCWSLWCFFVLGFSRSNCLFPSNLRLRNIILRKCWYWFILWNKFGLIRNW